jgi:hypothetical protein
MQYVAGTTIHRKSSPARVSARKLGINIPTPKPSLPDTEQEETDIA